MTIYMLRDKLSGLYYRRGPGYSTNWVQQNKASAWTEKSGPAACLGIINKRNERGFIPRDPEIVKLLCA